MDILDGNTAADDLNQASDDRTAFQAIYKDFLNRIAEPAPQTPVRGLLVKVTGGVAKVSFAGASLHLGFQVDHVARRGLIVVYDLNDPDERGKATRIGQVEFDEGGAVAAALPPSFRVVHVNDRVGAHAVLLSILRAGLFRKPS
jgi:hypothetical protein